jgi:flavin-dependent dehydrogenase
MASPMNGSGVGPAMRAGKILADTILALGSTHQIYTAADLWAYQYRYFREFGAAFAQLNNLKNWMMTCDMHDIDFALSHGLIAADDLERSIKGLAADSSIQTMVLKALKGFVRLDILLRLKSMLDKGKSIFQHYQNLPENYDELAIKQWRMKGDALFADARKKLEEP